MGDPTDSPIPKLITSFHPTLSTRSVRSVSELHPEGEYGPGSVEYEVTADFLRLSMRSTASSPVLAEIREGYETEEKDPQPGPSRITFQGPPEFRRSLRPISINTISFEEKTRPTSFGSVENSHEFISSTPIRMSKAMNITPTSLPVETEKINTEEGLAPPVEGDTAEQDNACFGNYRIPRGSLFFLFGFLFIPIWWYGAIFPRQPNHKVDLRWRSYNRMMSVVSIIIIAVGLGMLIWFLV
ncbi:hypothetical protein K7432_003342 [Basidiobolus ranarum]|uniref:Uncharacterized protein n=1 Tax=Basidiobolus ranarum TaxID=34480 RepID=A0ABR2X036_9FUNG